MSQPYVSEVPANGGNVTVQLPGGGTAIGTYNPTTNTVYY